MDDRLQMLIGEVRAKLAELEAFLPEYRATLLMAVPVPVELLMPQPEPQPEPEPEIVPAEFNFKDSANDTRSFKASATFDRARILARVTKNHDQFEPILHFLEGGGATTMPEITLLWKRAYDNGQIPTSVNRRGGTPTGHTAYVLEKIRNKGMLEFA